MALDTDSAPQTVRPPVALGCFAAAAALVVLCGVVVFFVRFLESGADDGKVRMEVPEAYAAGSVEFVGARNFFLVRLRDGSFVALSDLDAANRGNQAQRCRVQLTALSDPSLGASTEALRARMSTQATGADAVLRENCNGAVYDLAGALLSGDGRNLDRFPITLDASGRLQVDTSKRECSERSASTTFVSVDCS